MELNLTILVQLSIFLVLLWFLSGWLFEPFKNLFEERERRIVGAAHEAKQLGSAADETAQMIEQRTQAAQSEARQVLTDLRTQAIAREKAIVEEAREKANERIDDARTELFTATEAARKSLRDEAKALSSSIVEKVLGRAA